MKTDKNDQNRCVNCNFKLYGNYCHNCGEKIISDHDKSIAHFFEEAFHFLTHFEGKFLTTLKAIFISPGKLSLDYCNGLRKPYFKPLSFFMLIVILYLIFPLLDGLNMQLKFYLNTFLTGNYFQKMVDSKMASRGIDFVTLSEIFHNKSEKVSKILLIIIIPATALFLKIVFPKNRKFFSDYLIISTEFCSFYILFTFFIMVIFFALLQAFSVPSNLVELIGMVINIGIVYTYSIVAFKRFFQQGKRLVMLKSLIFLPLFFFFFFVIYKDILFVTTMDLIK